METGKLKEILKKCVLCKGFNDEEIMQVLDDPHSNIEKYKKGEMIFGQGDTPGKVYILLEGKVIISKLTSSGKRIVLSSIQIPGDMFGEVYLFMGDNGYEVESECQKDTVVLELSERHFVSESDDGTDMDRKLLYNMLNVLAMKAYNLSNKVRLLGSSSLREKIALYLMENENDSGSVTMAISREEWADYMNVTRPSLSRELGNMVKEGLILISGKAIKILDHDRLEESCLG